MHAFIFPSKDTTIYTDEITQNTGKDEILEIMKKPVTELSSSYVLNGSSSLFINQYVSSSFLSRILMQFDLSYISKSIVDGVIDAPRFYLNMHVCRVEGQEESSNLYIYPVTESWIEGIGKRFDQVIRTMGASWLYRDGENYIAWTITGSSYISGSTVVTASLWPNEDDFQSSEHYVYELADLRADVSDIIYGWLSGSIKNNGFLIKRSNEEESDIKDYGLIQFYSSDTNTVYPPSLEIAWDDSSFVTGSLTASLADDVFIFAKNLKTKYNSREKAKINVGTRELFPSRSYASENPYIQNKYLPSSSYYSIYDAHTTETIIPFDTASTKLSCDSNGNFFNLWMNGFQPDRFYGIKIKVLSGSFENIFDISTNFKVVK